MVPLVRVARTVRGGGLVALVTNLYDVLVNLHVAETHRALTLDTHDGGVVAAVREVGHVDARLERHLREDQVGVVQEARNLVLVARANHDGLADDRRLEDDVDRARRLENGHRAAHRADAHRHAVGGTLGKTVHRGDRQFGHRRGGEAGRDGDLVVEELIGPLGQREVVLAILEVVALHQVGTQLERYLQVVRDLLRRGDREGRAGRKLVDGHAHGGIRLRIGHVDDRFVLGRLLAPRRKGGGEEQRHCKIFQFHTLCSF